MPDRRRADAGARGRPRPAEARNAIGKVGKDTEPVVHMLKKIGFKYLNQVDPFDGGPHLWANVSDLLPIQNVFNGKVKKSAHLDAASDKPLSGLST